MMNLRYSLVPALLSIAASAQGIQPRTGEVLFSSEITRGDVGDQFGRSVDVIGDLNDDGVIDLVVGASHDDDGATDSGSVWILFMTPNMTVKAQMKISQTMGGFDGVLGVENWFGKEVSGIGDLDGDGVEDIAVGAPSRSISADRAVYILFLRPNGSVRDWTRISRTTNGFGRSLANMGDLNGDGVNDLMIGTGYGQAYTYYLNADGSVQSSKTYGTRSSSSGFQSFYSIGMEPIGDWDGDGIVDVAIGDTSNDMAATDGGAMFISLMGSGGTRKSETPIYEGLPQFDDLDLPGYPNFGRDAALLSDMDGNGVPDLAIGCSEYYNANVPLDSGAVFVTFLEEDGQVLGYKRISYLSGNLRQTLTLVDEFGISLAPLGDINGDGSIDMVVGARFKVSGSIFILRMNDGSLEFPAANGRAFPRQGPLPLSVQFTDTSTGSVTGWLWDFGDGSTSTDQNPVHLYTEAGNFPVSLTVSGPGMMSDTILFTNPVNAQPPLNSIARFDADPLEGLAPLSVDFSDRSQGGVNSWSWDFGDGNASNAQSPTHVYNSPGSYTPVLDVDGPRGMAQTSLPAPIIVHPAVLPQADFSLSGSAGVVPFSVSFTDTSLGFVDGWFWNFGDGNTSTAENPTHVYNSAGSFDVSLSVGNGVGSDSKTLFSAVAAVLPALPLANFQATPMSGSTPLLVSFMDLSLGQVDSWLWDFGDGASSTQQNPTHTYTKAGDFDVSLSVTNLGGTDSWTLNGAISCSQTIDVRPFDQGINGTDAATGSGWVMYTAESVESRFAASPPSFGDVSDHLILVVDLQGVWHYDTNTSYVPFTPRASDRLLATINYDNDSAQMLVGTSGVVNGIASGYASGDLNVIGNLWNGGTNTGEFGCSGSFIVIGSASPAPTPAFSVDTSLGSVPLTVSFLDASTGAASAWLWDFGDGNSSTLQNPVHTYTSVGSYSVSLLASNAAGSNLRNRPDLITVSVPPPLADFSLSPGTGSAPLAVQFTDLSSGNPSAWNWDFGDGSSSSLQNPVHVFGEGTYSISLSASNGGGSDSHFVEDALLVLPMPPLANFSVDSSQGAAPHSVQFSDLSEYAPDAWSWDFGDGNTSTAQHPSHTYTSAGSYMVSLLASNLGGSHSFSLGFPILITDAAPQAAFSASVSSGPAPLAVQFSDTSSGTPTAWSWDFGDGATSQLQHPLHVFQTPGSYSVVLTASNPSGSTGFTLGTPIDVQMSIPTASFVASSSGGPAPLTVQFSDTTAGGPTSWSWDFGDGGSSTLQHPSHVYNNEGTYQVSLSASNTSGSDSYSLPGDINVLAPVPTASFSVDVASGTVPLSVQFSDTSGESPSAWLWDFGDGSSSTSQHPSHTYLLPGSYPVSLTASNSSGSDVYSLPAPISALQAPPTAQFSVLPSSGSAPLAVQFTDLSSESPNMWSWDFGDGNGSNLQHPAHVYASRGAYDVSLTVTGVSGMGSITKQRLVQVDLSEGIGDGSFESSPPAAPPALPWSVLLGTGHKVQPELAPSDLGMPREGIQWLEVSAEGSVAATPPSNPGGTGTPPVGGAGIEQLFLLPASERMLKFGAAFLLAGNQQDLAFNDWMSIDLSDGVTSVNLFYRDSFSGFPLTSAIHALPMTPIMPVSVDLDLLFPGAVQGTAFTLSIQVGNGGDGQLHSLGYVDNIRLETSAQLQVYGCGVNPAGSMQVRGSAQLGQVMYFDLDNPLGTQCAASTSVDFFLTRQPDPLYPCGSLRAGFGMSPGVGENLVNWSNPADRFMKRRAPAWNGPGQPTTVAMLIPQNVALVGFELYGQALFIDSAALCGVRFGLTNGAYIRIGL